MNANSVMGAIFNLIKVRPEEIRIFIPFFLCMTAIGIANLWGTSIAMGLFVSNVGAEGLPFSFILRDASVILFSLIYTVITNRHASGTITQWFLGLNMGFALLMWFYMSIIGGPTTDTFCYVLLMGITSISIVLALHLSSWVSYYFTTIQRKRLSAVIFSGLSLGFVVGGGVYQVLVYNLSLSSLQLFLGVFLFLGIAWFCVRYITKHFNEMVSSLQAKRTTLVQNITQGFRLLPESRLIVFMCILMFVFFWLNTFIIYQANALFESHFQPVPEQISTEMYETMIQPYLKSQMDREQWNMSYQFDASNQVWIHKPTSMTTLDSCKRLLSHTIYKQDQKREALTSFFMIYEIVSNILVFLIQLFITPWIIARMGVGSGNFVYSGLNLVSALVLSIHAFFPVLSLASGAIARFFHSEFRKSIFTPIRNLLFNGIPSQYWPTVHAFLSSFIIPIGTSTASLTLIFFVIPLSQEPGWHSLPSFLTVFLAILFILLSIPQKKSYEQSILQLLTSRKLHPANLEALNLGKLDQHTFRIVSDLLLSEKEEDILLGIELCNVIDDTRIIQLLKETYIHNTTVIRKEVLKVLYSFESKQIYEVLVYFLEEENQEDLVYDILNLLSENTNVALYPQIQSFFEHASIPLRFAARKVVYKNNQTRDEKKQAIEAYLNAHLHDSAKPEFLLEAIRTAGELGIKALLPAILELAGTTNIKARKAMVGAIIQLADSNNKQAFDVLVKYASKKNYQVSMHALLGLQKFIPIYSQRVVFIVFKHLNKDHPTHRKYAYTILEKSIMEIHPILKKALIEPEWNAVQKQDMLSLLHKNNLLTEDCIDHVCNNQFEKISYLSCLYNAIMHRWNSISPTVQMMWQKIIEEEQQTFYAIMIPTLVYASKADASILENIENFIAGMRSTNKNDQANTLEAISNLGKLKWISAFVKYYELDHKNSTLVRNFYTNEIQVKNSIPDTIESLLEYAFQLNNTYLNAILLYIFQKQNEEALMEPYLNLIPKNDKLSKELIRLK